MRQLEMGDDAARASGVNINRTWAFLMVLGVTLTATVTSAASPVAFISLAAPQIARRITRPAGVTLVPSALIGSLLLATADYAAQHALPTHLLVVDGQHRRHLLHLAAPKRRKKVRRNFGRRCE